MRRSCLAPLLALGLLSAPLAAIPATAQTHAAASTTDAAGTSATLRSAASTSGKRLARPAAVTRKTAAKPATRPAGSRLARPVAKPVVKPVVKPVARPAAPVAAPTAAPVARPVTQPVAQPVTQPVAQPVAPPVAEPIPVTVAPAPRSGAYAFLNVDAGRPTRWNPCADVPWTFNPEGAPAGGLAAVQAALRELGARTGLTFAYQGTTTQAPVGSYLQQSWRQFKPLLVGWTSAEQSDLLRGRPASTVGLTRVLWTGSYDSTGANRTQIASGIVALNTATKAPATGNGSWYTYALHELGHAVGLAHVEDDTQIMNPVISSSLAGYGDGDVAGLSLVGRDGGCLPDIR